MEKTSLRRATAISVSILAFLLLCFHGVNAIEIRELQRVSYNDRYLPFYSQFVDDTHIFFSGNGVVKAYARSDLTNCVYHLDGLGGVQHTVQGNMIVFFGNFPKYPQDYYYFNPRSQSLMHLLDVKEQLKDDYYYGYSFVNDGIDHFPQWIQPIFLNDTLVPYKWSEQPEHSISYDIYTDMDHMVEDKATIPDYRKKLGEIYRQTVNSNHGMSYPLEMYFRMGDQKSGKYGFMSLSDDKQWTITTYTAKKPERLWRVQGSFWGSYEFRIPYWKFLNPRFVIGPYEAYIKDETKGPDCEIYRLGVLDTKGNAITNNIICLLDFDVSLNGRYLIVTGVEDKGNQTKWNGDYPTILYEVSFSGMITDNKVRLRDTPGTDGKILSVLGKGQSCTVIEHSKTRQTIDGVKECWYKIRLSNGIEGWVFGAWLDYW